MATHIAPEHHEEHTEGHHHITPPSVFLKTFAALIVLMALTVWVSTVPLGALNNAVALVIAITKATLVVLFFMQVKYGTRLTWLWAGIGFVWFLLMLTIVTDYVTREWIHVYGWQTPYLPK